MANILIAEDEDALRHLVSRALRLDGHEVSAAEDGEEALERLQEADGEFDLVLSDIRMPGLTGIELAHAIAQRWPHVKVLLMTGYAEQKEAAEDLATIIEGVLDKPFAIGDVRRQVCEIVAAASQAPSRRSACA
ncbi:MAG: response regulator [Fulvimarina manganoxydans]|uniref:response regulator n=1 Tax=Fulvimarina manganoxydans TaxID=937218 RepID=UPI00235392C0|nr:response regulator [Fulvimarina manganoxydans]MCK5933536.1 response regulator [Fulvimarina manganoxydans]